MIVTEEAAEMKWCPFTRSGMHGTNTSAGLNRPADFIPGTVNCIGSACMAWRWLTDDENQIVGGYCGLAGKPEP